MTTKKKNNSSSGKTSKLASKTLAASVLTKKSAKKFDSAAKTFAIRSTTSKQKARSTLIDMGIYTKTGRLAKKYG